MKVYNIYRKYEIYGDNFCGDEYYAIGYDHIATFESEADAQKFIENHGQPCTEHKHYDCGAEVDIENEYIIKEMEIISHMEFNIHKTPKEYGICMLATDYTIPIAYLIGDSYDDEEVE